MKSLYIYIGVAILVIAVLLIGNKLSAGAEEYVIHSFDKIRLSSTFYAEGAGIGDLNGDGNPDVMCGPYWYKGPAFEDRYAFYEPVEFDPLEYSDNFIVEVEDVNEDGHNDILIVGFPGEEAFWYENPGNGDAFWEQHLIYPEVGNESAQFTDVSGDGKLDLVYNTDGYLGYASRDPENPTAPWIFTPVSEPKDFGQYTHGLGVGDITGNGQPDFMMAGGWWENPGRGWDGQSSWDHHQIEFAPAGVQMYAYDVDGDGLNDVITSLEAHGWGLAWYRQGRQNNGGSIDFEQHLIMGESYEDNSYGVRFSQPHALALSDVDADGNHDLLSGKRWWAHGPDGDPEPNAAAVLYWFKPDQDENGAMEFIPYQIDDDSGVGVEIATGDLSGNGYPDVAICNKKGGFVFLNQPRQVSREEWEEAQPEKLQ